MLVDFILWVVFGSQDEHRSVISAVATIVAGTEDRDASPLVLLFETAPVLWQLMAPNYESEAIRHAELGGHVRAELDADSPF
jgi:hypothetical protein